MKHIKRDQFIWDFQNHETIPNCYEKVLLNETVFTNETARANPEHVLYVSLVPTYLDYVLVNHNAYHHKKISHKGKDVKTRSIPIYRNLQSDNSAST